MSENPWTILKYFLRQLLKDFHKRKEREIERRRERERERDREIKKDQIYWFFVFVSIEGSSSNQKSMSADIRADICADIRAKQCRCILSLCFCSYVPLFLSFHSVSWILLVCVFRRVRRRGGSGSKKATKPWQKQISMNKKTTKPKQNQYPGAKKQRNLSKT